MKLTIPEAVVLHLDVETTGPDPVRHAVVRLSWAIEVGGQVVTEDSLRVRAFKDAEYDPEIFAGTGLKPSDMLEGHTESAVILRFVSELSAHVTPGTPAFFIAGIGTEQTVAFAREMAHRVINGYLVETLSNARLIDLRSVVMFLEAHNLAAESLVSAVVPDSRGAAKRGYTGTEMSQAVLNVLRRIFHAVPMITPGVLTVAKKEAS